MSMAAAKLPPPDAGEDLIPFNMRMPRRIVEALDEWVEDLNRGRRVGKVTRSDVVRVLLERGAVLRPSLDEQGAPGAPLAILHDEEGREVAVSPLEQSLANDTVLRDPRTGRDVPARLMRAHYALLHELAHSTFQQSDDESRKKRYPDLEDQAVLEDEAGGVPPLLRDQRRRMSKRDK